MIQQAEDIPPAAIGPSAQKLDICVLDHGHVTVIGKAHRPVQGGAVALTRAMMDVYAATHDGRRPDALVLEPRAELDLRCELPFMGDHLCQLNGMIVLVGKNKPCATMIASCLTEAAQSAMLLVKEGIA